MCKSEHLHNVQIQDGQYWRQIQSIQCRCITAIIVRLSKDGRFITEEERVRSGDLLAAHCYSSIRVVQTSPPRECGPRSGNAPAGKPTPPPSSSVGGWEGIDASTGGH